MLEINNVISETLMYSFDEYSNDEIVFFDIETTGFSADTCSLYLIGCVYYENNSWNYIQWFANSKNDEVPILNSFFEFIKKYKLLIGFNTEGFDIPFILKKCIKNNLILNFDNIVSFDLLKKIRPYKNILNLTNCKQKTVELFLNLNREDTYNGGELINVYKKYLKLNSIDNSSSKKTAKSLLNILLLHNKEDICDMLFLTKILDYIDLCKGNILIKELNFINIIDKNKHIFKTSIDNLCTNLCNIDANFIEFNLKCNKKFDIDINYSSEYNEIRTSNDIITIKIPIVKKELKYFFDNYKDYYYLPKEDRAIHKSIAEYVAKEHKQKAKSSNCYTKKIGYFIPYNDKNKENISNYPIFKENYKEKLSFIEICNKNINNPNFIKDLLYLV